MSTDEVYKQIIEQQSKRIKQEEKSKPIKEWSKVAQNIVTKMLKLMTQKGVTEDTAICESIIGSNYLNSLTFNENQFLLLEEINKKLVGDKKIKVYINYKNFGISRGATYQDSDDVIDVFDVTFRFI